MRPPAFPVTAVSVRSGGLLSSVLPAGGLLATVAAAQPTASRSPEKTPERFRAMSDRQHIHVVVRTPNGNDYGRDLLRRHLADHPH